jgi:hypothetical protein
MVYDFERVEFGAGADSLVSKKLKLEEAVIKVDT